jgi:hypothetical protein
VNTVLTIRVLQRVGEFLTTFSRRTIQGEVDSSGKVYSIFSRGSRLESRL